MSTNKIIDFEEYKYFNSPEFKSNELLEEALDSVSKNKSIKLAKQALELYPDNIDAENLIAEYEDNPIKRLKKYDNIIEKATKLLEQQNMFDKENIGDFWLILETRPYMRTRYSKILVLMDLGRYTEAIKECEDLLHLCNNDNMGIRYILIGLYCVLEKFEECEKLYKKYKEESLFMLFAMSIMYFKKGNYKKAKQYLAKSEEQNEFVLDFLLNGNGEFLHEIENDYYSYGSEEEAFIVLHDLIYLIGSVPSFITFIVKEYRKK